MLSVLHCADLHLDTPVAQKGGMELLRGVLHSIGTQIANRNAQLVLMAGDVFDASAVTRTTVQLLKKLFEDHPQTYFVLAAGNHDPYTQNSVYAQTQWPANVHVFTQDCLQCISLEHLDCDVYGASFTDRQANSYVLDGFALKDPSKINIIVLHGEIDTADYRGITEAQLADCGADYVALGHIHTQSGLRKAGGTAYAWPGCPQGRGFDECGEKGIYALQISKGKVEAEFLPLAVKQYKIIQVQVEGITSNTQLGERCAELAKKEKNAFLRLEICGRTENGFFPNPALVREFDQVLAEVEFTDKTRPSLDMTALAEERSVRGAFFRRLQPQLESEDERTHRVAQLALHAGLAALEGEEMPL